MYGLGSVGSMHECRQRVAHNKRNINLEYPASVHAIAVYALRTADSRNRSAYSRVMYTIVQKVVAVAVATAATATEEVEEETIYVTCIEERGRAVLNDVPRDPDGTVCISLYSIGQASRAWADCESLYAGKQKRTMILRYFHVAHVVPRHLCLIRTAVCARKRERELRFVFAFDHLFCTRQCVLYTLISPSGTLSHHVESSRSQAQPFCLCNTATKIHTPFSSFRDVGNNDVEVYCLLIHDTILRIALGVRDYFKNVITASSFNNNMTIKQILQPANTYAQYYARVQRNEAITCRRNDDDDDEVDACKQLTCNISYSRSRANTHSTLDKFVPCARANVCSCTPRDRVEASSPIYARYILALFDFANVRMNRNEIEQCGSIQQAAAIVGKFAVIYKLFDTECIIIESYTYRCAAHYAYRSCVDRRSASYTTRYKCICSCCIVEWPLTLLRESVRLSHTNHLHTRTCDAISRAWPAHLLSLHHVKLGSPSSFDVREMSWEELPRARNTINTFCKHFYPKMSSLQMPCFIVFLHLNIGYNRGKNGLQQYKESVNMWRLQHRKTRHVALGAAWVSLQAETIGSVASYARRSAESHYCMARLAPERSEGASASVCSRFPLCAAHTRVACSARRPPGSSESIAPFTLSSQSFIKDALSRFAWYIYSAHEPFWTSLRITAENRVGLSKINEDFRVNPRVLIGNQLGFPCKSSWIDKKSRRIFAEIHVGLSKINEDFRGNPRGLRTWTVYMIHVRSTWNQCPILEESLYDPRGISVDNPRGHPRNFFQLDTAAVCAHCMDQLQGCKYTTTFFFSRGALTSHVRFAHTYPIYNALNARAHSLRFIPPQRRSYNTRARLINSQAHRAPALAASRGRELKGGLRRRRRYIWSSNWNNSNNDKYGVKITEHIAITRGSSSMNRSSSDIDDDGRRHCFALLRSRGDPELNRLNKNIRTAFLSEARKITSCRAVYARGMLFWNLIRDDYPTHTVHRNSSSQPYTCH
ncbi:unnamed protein product, partial [Trichogramma brassicae]